MAAVGSLTVDLTANTASFNSNIEKAAKNLNSSASQMNRSLDSVKKNISAMRAEAEGLALGLAIKQAANFVKSNLDLVGSLGEAAQQLGVTTRELQTYRAIGGQFGVTNEEMDQGLQRLTMALGKASVGAKAQGDVFTALGINVRDASGHVQGTGVVIEQIAEKLSKIEDPAQRAAAEVAIFGRAGQKLDTILTGGKKGIQEYAQRAQDMGMVLSDDLVAAADAASDKMTELNAQLTANIGQAVAQNAGSILGLANALQSLTVRAINFINTNPRLVAALTGAALGSRFGAVGAAIGAAGGVVAGQSMAQASADGNMDLAFRRRQLEGARQALARRMNPAPVTAGGLFTVHSGASSSSSKDAIEQVRKQTALLRQATAEARKPHGPVMPNVDLPNFMAGGGGGRSGGGHSGPSAEALFNKNLQQTKDYQDQDARLNDQLLDAKRANIVDVSEIGDYERRSVNVEMDKLQADLDINAQKNPLLAAHKDELHSLIEQVRVQKLSTIAADDLRKKWDDELNLQIAANDNQKDFLNVQEQLALTQGDRRRIQLAILEAEQNNLRLELQKAMLNSKDVEEKKRIQAQLDAAPALYAAKAQNVRNQTLSPLEEYSRQISLSKEQLAERAEGLVVEELQHVHEGISSAISNALGVGDDPLINSLLDILLDQILFKPIAAALSKASGAGGGGILGSILGSVVGGGGGLSKAALKGYATGTNNAPPGYAWVGEKGPEIVNFRGGESVIPNHKLGGGGMSISVVPSPYFEVVVNQQIAGAAPAIADAGAQTAMRRSAYRQSRSLDR